MILYIIRHGDPIYSTDSLTERGKLQAEAVAKRMQQAGINKVFSSPMGRAKMTAEPTCRLLGLDCAIEDWAHEIEDDRLTPFPDGKMKSVTLPRKRCASRFAVRGFSVFSSGIWRRVAYAWTRSACTLPPRGASPAREGGASRG